MREQALHLRGRQPFAIQRAQRGGVDQLMQHDLLGHVAGAIRQAHLVARAVVFRQQREATLVVAQAGARQRLHGRGNAGANQQACDLAVESAPGCAGDHAQHFLGFAALAQHVHDGAVGVGALAGGAARAHVSVVSLGRRCLRLVLRLAFASKALQDFLVIRARLLQFGGVGPFASVFRGRKVCGFLLSALKSRLQVGHRMAGTAHHAINRFHHPAVGAG